MADIKLSIVTSTDASQILGLYRAAGWWQTDDNPEYLTTVAGIVRNTLCFVIATEGDKIVGMGRAIGDGVSDAYIQDVTVLPEYRGQGIGKAIIRHLVAHLKEIGLQWIGLISEPGYERFYQSLGFAVMKNYTPFLLKED